MDDELLLGLKKLKQQTLAPEAAMIRQAIAEYLERRGVDVSKAAPRRATTRRKA